MKNLLKGRFLHADCDQILFIQFQNCAQGNRTVSEYTEEFLRLQMRCNLAESEDQQVARYINGLNDAIQDRLMMQQIWSLDQAQALALKAERMLKTRKAGKTPYPHTEDSSRSYSHRVEEEAAQPKAKQLVPKQTRSKSRAKPLIKCYKCGEERHVSSDCPLRKFVNTTTHDGEDGEEYESEDVEGQDICEEKGEEVVCVIQRLLCSTPQPDNKRKKIFESKCTVNGKVCKLVIDSCSRENLISQNLVNHLKLETRDHPNPYTIGWIKKGTNIRITKQCNLPLSLDEYYRSNVLCDVVDMDASHVLLGRPWQFDVDATHKGKQNSYSFTWNKRKIIILPNQSNGNTSKEEGKSMLTLSHTSNEFMEDMKEANMCVALIAKGGGQPAVEIPARGASPPNLPHHQMSPKEHAILKEEMEAQNQKHKQLADCKQRLKPFQVVTR
uniref:Uncharacterized protein n=1 Tax=Avena sativa TaxID=4498 RepID=A0ACD5Y723_AVESA